jgi:lysophospholipase L1-like esterase
MAPNAKIFVGSVPPIVDSGMYSDREGTRNAYDYNYMTQVTGVTRPDPPDPQKPGGIMNMLVIDNQKVFFVDHWSALAGAHISDDKVHPNGAGYRRMAQTWWEKIRECMP